MSLVVSVPQEFVDLLGPVDGAEVVGWDMVQDPPRTDLEIVVVPPFGARWVKRLRELPALRAVITATAGYEHVLPFLPAGVTLANAVGVHDTATAELALALTLAAQRDLPELVRAQDQGRWVRHRRRRGLAGCRVLVVGYGGVGRAVAGRMLACETEVTAVASRAREGDDLVGQVHEASSLPELLPHHEVVVLCVPLGPETAGLFGAGLLSRMADDALLVNVARGGVVDTEALRAECAGGRLRAALDVTDPEPLPDGHPLWSTPGVIISHHTGGGTRVFPPRGASYVRRQVETFLRTGELDHVVATGPPTS